MTKAVAAIPMPVSQPSSSPSYVWTDPSDCIDMQTSSFRGAFGPNSSFEEAANPQSIDQKRLRSTSSSISQNSGLTIGTDVNGDLLVPSADSSVWVNEARSNPAPIASPFMMFPGGMGNVFGASFAPPDAWLNMDGGRVVEGISPMTTSPAASIAQQTLASPDTEPPKAMGSTAQSFHYLQPTAPSAPVITDDMALYGTMFGHSSFATFVPAGQDTSSVYSGMQPAMTTNMPFLNMPGVEMYFPAAWTPSPASSGPAMPGVFPVTATSGPFIKPFNSNTLSTGPDVAFVNTTNHDAAPSVQLPATSAPDLTGVPTITAMTKTMMARIPPPAPARPMTKLQKFQEMERRKIEFNELRKLHMAQTNPIADGNDMAVPVTTTIVPTAVRPVPIATLATLRPPPFTTTVDIAPRRSMISPVTRGGKRKRASASGPSRPTAQKMVQSMSSPLTAVSHSGVGFSAAVADSIPTASPQKGTAQPNSPTSTPKKRPLPITIEDDEDEEAPKAQQPNKKTKTAKTKIAESSSFSTSAAPMAGSTLMTTQSQQSGVSLENIDFYKANNNVDFGFNFNNYEPTWDYASDSSDELDDHPSGQLAGATDFFFGGFQCYDDLVSEKPEDAVSQFTLGEKKEEATPIPFTSMSVTAPGGQITAITIFNRTFITHFTDTKQVQELVDRVTAKFQAEAAEAEATKEAVNTGPTAQLHTIQTVQTPDAAGPAPSVSTQDMARVVTAAAEAKSPRVHTATSDTSSFKMTSGTETVVPVSAAPLPASVSIVAPSRVPITAGHRLRRTRSNTITPRSHPAAQKARAPSISGAGR
ncbi:hypothetical protein SBRCBS47491_009376 [Sporothrix bragantina]|uniref:Uncharacterized protein n=1 Tax=Sporothrix bragantina TaxID=671064 RepID=A0ABP0CU77_9PEZI